MDINRRFFLAGTAAAAGLVTAAGAQKVGAAAVENTANMFGPLPGQAQLSRNENPYGPAPSAIRAIAESAVKGCYYTDRGEQVLVEMIAERHGVDPSQIVMGNGSTEILAAIALAWGKKGAILCPDLFWDTTVKYGERQGVKAIRVPLKADMDVDLDTMAGMLGDDVGLVQLVNPNNPTGMLIDNAALRNFAAKVKASGTTLLVDEAYNELTDLPEANSLVDLVRAGDDVIVCRTFSKIYGMAGLRVGYAITSAENAAVIRSYLMSLGVNEAGLAGAIAAYNDDAFLESSKGMIVEARGMIMDAVAKAGLTALPSQTNFVYVVVPDANAVQAAMAERGIGIRPAYGKWVHYSRVSTGKLEDVARYAAALPEVIASLKA